MPETRALPKITEELADALEKAETLAHEATDAAFEEKRLTQRVQHLRDAVQGVVPLARSVASEAARSE